MILISLLVLFIQGLIIDTCRFCAMRDLELDCSTCHLTILFAHLDKFSRLFHENTRGRCMVNEFGWKLILRADQCRLAEEVLCLRPWLQDGWPSFLLATYLVIPF